MKVVIAIDSFKGSMSSIEAGEAAAAGIRKVYSEAKTKVYPLAGWRGRDSAALARDLGKLGECDSYWTTWSPGCLRICNLGET